ncbi:hypothetical protein WN51_00441 [Melipona quadrifasciata]|uniref:Uncharacterized protein n=1 Tax=Melipona quadrifasciata TaxID=166423 RepID=A0A0N0U574_9HYME|nr:hypothetical protein WN51_00441 [Melipona quadrifasciata]
MARGREGANQPVKEGRDKRTEGVGKGAGAPLPIRAVLRARSHRELRLGRTRKASTRNAGDR